MSAVPECVLVLASASPRRRRLVSWLGLPVRFMAVDTPEELDSPLSSDPPRLASHLAAEKARAAVDELAGVWNGGSGSHTGGTGQPLAENADDHAPGAPRVVVAFDTIVVLDGRLLGKPIDIEDAWRMLRALSGRTHEVITGVAIHVAGRPAVEEFSVRTRVRMKQLTHEQIEEWMAVGEFMGCAGAYNIEGQVAEVDLDECFQNVAGLPLCHLRAALARLGAGCDLAGLESPQAQCDEALGRRCELAPTLATDASRPG